MVFNWETMCAYAHLVLPGLILSAISYDEEIWPRHLQLRGEAKPRRHLIKSREEECLTRQLMHDRSGSLILTLHDDFS